MSVLAPQISPTHQFMSCPALSMVFRQLGRLFGQLREAGIKNARYISYVKLRTIEDQIEDEIEVNRGQLR